jgi:hypothetical protein
MTVGWVGSTMTAWWLTSAGGVVSLLQEHCDAFKEQEEYVLHCYQGVDNGCLERMAMWRIMPKTLQ